MLQSLKDRYLAIAVSVFVLIDIVILTTFTVIDGIEGKLGAVLVANKEQLTSEVGVSSQYDD